MSDRYILNDAGQAEPCPDIIAWARWFEGGDSARRVATDLVGDVRVSTVFLGLDHRFGEQGDPILWETMIFGGPHDGYQERYTSREQAVEGHAIALGLAKT